nr:MAG TPA: Cytosine specific methyltransferase [Caudoviricetes sp.]
MTAYALDRQGAGNTNVILASSGKVRRLTPLECERLQGFPDNYTRITWRNKPAEQCPDAPRYMAIGNSMAVPVMRWIGERMCKA